MPRFFIRADQISDGKVTILGDDAHHIARSLRMATGESVTVCDMQGNEYVCRITAFDADRSVSADIISASHADTELACRVCLFQALTKGDKLDTVIQKSVECGVHSIVPFESERCIARTKDGAEDRKTERRAKIALSAAGQCGRSVLPEVSPTVSFDKMIELAQGFDVVLFCYEGDGTSPLGTLIAERVARRADGTYPSVAVIVGSEGGFSRAEAERARAAGFCMTGLGKRILRAETAPIFVLSCIVCATELSD